MNPFDSADPVTHRTEEAARMMQLNRHCAGCSEERLYEPIHAEAASCPDAPDGECREWACPICGDALFIGLPPPAQVAGDRAVRAA